VHDVHLWAGDAADPWDALVMRVHLDLGQAVGIVGQAHLVHALLHVVGRADPDDAIVLAFAGLDPVGAVQVDIVVVTPEKDAIALGYGEHRTTGGRLSTWLASWQKARQCQGQYKDSNGFYAYTLCSHLVMVVLSDPGYAVSKGKTLSRTPIPFEINRYFPSYWAKAAVSTWATDF
jgi:hypothetical protein